MFKISRKAIRCSGSALAIVIAFAVSAKSVSAGDRTYSIHIPTENTAAALNDFSRQTNIQILFPYDVAAAHTAPAIAGEFTRAAALAELLKGTGLQIVEVTSAAITLKAEDKSTPQAAASDSAATQVIVTGTHIRGADPTSPVHTITKSDIEASGYSQIGDLMRSLPENFGGGQNPGVVYASAGNIANQNLTNASTVNLRGLGSDATLVLVDGHRLNADSTYQGVDISGIPLGAVQRIEVVPDGASALYGSDAVAGVVNIILRKDLNGGEWSARVGDTSQGGGLEQTYSLMDGASTSRGHVLADFEYSRQQPITAGERAFTAGVDPTFSLEDFQERRSLFVNAGYDFSDRLSAGLDVMLDDRRSIATATTSGQFYTTPVYTPEYNLAGTLNASLPADWNLKGTVVASGSRNSYWSKDLTDGYFAHTQYQNWTQYAEVTADGPLFTLPSGTVKGAIGGGVREEGFQNGYTAGASYYRPTRDIDYLYGEALVPFVTPSAVRTGLNELELNLSGRVEHYSDIGSSATPKVGLRYVPLPGLTLHSTWGKSFKAPSLLQMHEAIYLLLYPASYVGGTGSGPVLETYGGNPNLKPERSTSWTIGGDYKLPWAQTSSFGLDYYHIEYIDRVVQPVANFTQGLSNPLYAPFVEYGPSTAELGALVPMGVFYNETGAAYDPTKVQAILRDQFLNATSQTADGVDLSYKESFAVGHNTIDAFANATWTRLDQQTISTAPNAELSGTLFNVPKFRARGGATWEGGPFTFTGTVNYVSGQIDTGVNPQVQLASWTTVDANLSYRAGDIAAVAKGLKISLAVQNLFNKNPPWTVSPLTDTQPHYDSTAYSIVGRFISLTLSGSW